jgi:hypothetical protein
MDKIFWGDKKVRARTADETRSFKCFFIKILHDVNVRFLGCFLAIFKDKRISIKSRILEEYRTNAL